MDFSRFLAHAPRQLVLPYFGGSRVTDGTRQYKVDPELAPGWWIFRIDGQRGIAVQAASALPLEDHPRCPFIIVGGWGFREQITRSERAVLRLHHLKSRDDPQVEPHEILSRVSTRIWHDGSAIVEHTELDRECDLKLRQHYFNRGGPLPSIRGLHPGQRLAHLYAWLVRESQGTPPPPTSILPQLLAVIRGQQPASDLIDATQRPSAGGTCPLETHLYRELHKARAELLGYRKLDEERCLVRFRIDGHDIESLVDSRNLHVYDAGFCLDGHDEQLGLQSLPGVVREALESGELEILVHED